MGRLNVSYDVRFNLDAYGKDISPEPRVPEPSS